MTILRAYTAQAVPKGLMKEVRLEAEGRKIELCILPTDQAIKLLEKNSEEINAILHVTC